MITSIFEPHIFQDKLFPFFFERQYIRQNYAHSMNWHPNIEILFCCSGEGRIRCDTRSYLVRAGEMVVVNSQVAHSVETDTEIEYYFLIVGDEFCRENGIPSTELLFCEHICDVEAKDAFLRVADAILKRTPCLPLCEHANVRSCVLSLLCLLCNRFLLDEAKPVKTQAATRQRVKECMLYIKRNLREKITLDDLAKHVGVCKNHLAREFKKHTEITVVEYLNQQRCRHAQKLILEGESISSAAHLSGFENLSYFSRTYKRYIGYLPSETDIAPRLPVGPRS